METLCSPPYPGVMVRSQVARACVGLSVDPLLTKGERNTLLGCTVWKRMSASPFLHETDGQTEQIHSFKGQIWNLKVLIAAKGKMAGSP